MSQLAPRMVRAAAERALLAVGVSAPWEVQIDELSEPVDRWIMELSNRVMSVAFRLDDLGVVDRLRRFLDERLRNPVSASHDEVRLGSFSQARVTIRFDDESPLRCFLVAGPRADSLLFLTLQEEDVRALAKALDQVVEDLTSD